MPVFHSQKSVFADSVLELAPLVFEKHGFLFLDYDKSEFPVETRHKPWYADSPFEWAVLPDRCRFHIETKQLRIYIEHDVYNINTAIQFLTPNPLLDFSLKLPFVLEAISPNLGDKGWPIKLESNLMIRDEVERQLKLIIDNCNPLLENNTNYWTLMKKWEFDNGGRQQHEDEEIQVYVNRLLNNARLSWEDKYYWRCVDFYIRYKNNSGKLRLMDRLHYMYALRYTFFVDYMLLER